MKQEKREKVVTMHEQLVTLVSAMKKDDFKFDEQAAVFRWSYEEHPEIMFELAIYDTSLLEGDLDITETEVNADDLEEDWRKLH